MIALDQIDVYCFFLFRKGEIDFSPISSEKKDTNQDIIMQAISIPLHITQYESIFASISSQDENTEDLIYIYMIKRAGTSYTYTL